MEVVVVGEGWEEGMEGEVVVVVGGEGAEEEDEVGEEEGMMIVGLARWEVKGLEIRDGGVGAVRRVVCPLVEVVGEGKVDKGGGSLRDRLSRHLLHVVVRARGLSHPAVEVEVRGHVRVHVRHLGNVAIITIGVMRARARVLGLVLDLVPAHVHVRGLHHPHRAETITTTGGAARPVVERRHLDDEALGVGLPHVRVRGRGRGLLLLLLRGQGRIVGVDRGHRRSLLLSGGLGRGRERGKGKGKGGEVEARHLRGGGSWVGIGIGIEGRVGVGVGVGVGRGEVVGGVGGKGIGTGTGKGLWIERESLRESTRVVVGAGGHRVL